jgi:hypothetical protein
MALRDRLTVIVERLRACARELGVDEGHIGADNLLLEALHLLAEETGDAHVQAVAVTITEEYRALPKWYA